VAFDFQVTLNLASQDGIYAQRVDALLVIENDFTLTHEGGTTDVSPGQQLNYAAVLPLLHQTLRRAAIEADDSLALSFTGGFEVHVPRNDHYESWSLTGSGVTGWISGPR
jgi:hypothetical protein